MNYNVANIPVHFDQQCLISDAYKKPRYIMKTIQTPKIKLKPKYSEGQLQYQGSIEERIFVRISD